MSDRYAGTADEAPPPPDRAEDVLRRPLARPRAAEPVHGPEPRSETSPLPDRARWIPDAGDPAVAARSPSDITLAGDPVDVATGDVLLVGDDVTLPGALPLVISRSYRTSWRAGRWFGAPWASSLDERLQLGPDRVTGVFADGRILTWLLDPARRRPVPVTGLPVTGPRWRLERIGDDAFTVTDPQAGLVRRFESRGGDLPLVSMTDRAGRQIRFSYTDAGEPAWITHSGGYRIQVVVAAGRVAELRLADGSPVPLARYRYDPAGNLAGVTDGSGQALRLSYDADGRLDGWRDRNGISYRYSYDELGRCVSGSGPGGAMSGRFAYGDQVTRWTDAGGAVTTYQLDASSRVTAVTSPLGDVTHFWYDDCGRVSARADPLGRLTLFRYDERGNLIGVTRPDGSQLRARYDAANLLLALRYPDGTTWRQEHDGRGKLLRRIAPDNSVTSYGYDVRGHLASVTGPLGEVTTVDCDPAGLPVAVRSPGGGCVRYTRDPEGRVTSVTAPDGALTTLTWTAAGQLAGRVLADGSTEQRGYDAEGNLARYLGPAGEQVTCEYGPFDQLTAATGPGGIRTEYRYDHALRLTAVTRAGLTWRYDYDAAGQLVAETEFNGAVTRYAYDQAGQLVSRVNAAGQQVSYTYDELGLLIRREAGTSVTTFAYDAAGRLAQARGPDAELSLSRDPLGRVTAETCNGRTVLSTFDLAGRRIRRVTPGGAQQRWHYDHDGQPVLLESGGHALRFGYDQAGRETRRDLPGGLALTQEWDTAGQLARQVLTAAPDAGPGAGPQDDLARRAYARRAYAYRAGGCLAGVDDLLAGSRRFTLDDAGRVTQVGGDRWAEQYEYDPAGNVASARWSPPPPGPAGRWLSADLQGPRTRAGTLVTSAGTVRYRHDRQGRVIERQRARAAGPPEVWSYEWDADDRLTAVTTPDGSTWRYRYDPLGRRISKQRYDPSGTPAAETTFTWDGAVLAEESAGTPESGRQLTWDYRPGTFTPLVQSERTRAGCATAAVGGAFYVIVADQLGTPAELVAADGTVAGYQQHTLWGATLWHPDGAATPLRFPGQYHDPETGLHYNQQRYYDPVTGSYLTPDPLGLASAPNPHAYVPNPLLQADPLGLMSCDTRNTRPAGSSAWDEVPATGTSFIAKSSGEVVRIPDGASGPIPVRGGSGFQFISGSGGDPLDSRVAGIRVMDPVTSGKYQYPHGHVSYFNEPGQTVNPFTGRTIASSDPLWHWAWGSK